MEKKTNDKLPPMVCISQDVVDRLNNIKATKEGLREAMMLLIPLAAQQACSGNASWAKYLLSMAEKYLPEWRDKQQQLTMEDFIDVQKKLNSFDMSDDELIKMLVEE